MGHQARRSWAENIRGVSLSPEPCGAESSSRAGRGAFGRLSVAKGRGPGTRRALCPGVTLRKARNDSDLPQFSDRRPCLELVKLIAVAHFGESSVRLFYFWTSPTTSFWSSGSAVLVCKSGSSVRQKLLLRLARIPLISPLLVVFFTKREGCYYCCRFVFMRQVFFFFCLALAVLELAL